MHPAIKKALAHAVNVQGCTTQQAIGQVILSLIEIGIPMQTAYDAVLGQGAYQATADTTWELLQQPA